jgi:arabinogalactan endo-1,4-beta-galactosidase
MPPADSQRPLRRFVAAAACILLVFTAQAAASSTRSARVHAPAGFFGTVVDEPAALRADQLALMKQSGVQTIRVVFNWDETQHNPGPPNFAALDQTVRLASSAGLKILPIVMYTPPWASSQPSKPNYYLYAPAATSSYTAFLQALIGRYGPNGSFWSANPGVPKVPLRSWQIWNEPAFKFFWATQPYYKTYPKLLKAAYKAVHSADRGAKVVTAGLANTTANPSWRYMKLLYKNGLKGSFDILAVHPFAISISHLLTIVKYDQDVLKQHGDGRKPIYLTEMSWTSALGQIPSQNYLGFETTAAKQAKLLQQGYAALLRTKSLNVKAVFWFDWASRYVPTSIAGQEPSFQYAGLTKFDGVSTFSPMPVLSAYSKTAHAYR